MYHEIISRPNAKQWEIAMKEEIKFQMENKMWVLVNRPKNPQIVKCKWVFTVKADSRYKARLIAKGFMQIEEIDF